MIKKPLKFMLVSCLFALLFVLAACGNSNTTNETDAKTDNKSAVSATSSDEDIPKKKFKLAHITSTDHMWHKAAEKFNEELKSRSDGKMELEIYPASQLGTEADMVQQVEAGSIDFAFITAAFLSTRTPEMASWFAPYTFENLQEASDASHTDIAREILGKVDGTGLKGLDYLFAGQRTMVLKSKEVKKASDLAGLKMRVTPSPPLQKFYKDAGAAPEGLPLPEVYSALQTGVIDGMDMDLDATITNKYSEVAKYVAVTNHMVWPSIVVANEGMFDGLSENAQKIINESLQAAIAYAVETRVGQEEEFKKELASQGMTVYELGADVFKEQIEAFDAEYSAKSALIKQFINEFRK